MNEIVEFIVENEPSIDLEIGETDAIPVDLIINESANEQQYFPVGFIYATSGENPRDILGFGVWEPYEIITWAYLKTLTWGEVLNKNWNMSETPKGVYLWQRIG